MPVSRELQNKKNETKDRQSRTGVNPEVKKGGAGAHNWGNPGSESEGVEILDKGDPNYDSDAEDAKKN